MAASCSEDCYAVDRIAQGTKLNPKKYCALHDEFSTAMASCECEDPEAEFEIRDYVQLFISFCQSRWNSTVLQSVESAASKYGYAISIPATSPSVTSSDSPSSTGDPTATDTDHTPSQPALSKTELAITISIFSIAGAAVLVGVLVCIYIGPKKRRRWKDAVKNHQKNPIRGIFQLHGESLDPSKVPKGSSQECYEKDGDSAPVYELPANEPPAVELRSNSVSSRENLKNEV